MKKILYINKNDIIKINWTKDIILFSFFLLFLSNKRIIEVYLGKKDYL